MTALYCRVPITAHVLVVFQHPRYQHVPGADSQTALHRRYYMQKQGPHVAASCVLRDALSDIWAEKMKMLQH